MQVTINGEARIFDTVLTVAEIICLLEINGKIAVEINHQILPRSRFDDHIVHEGDVVEIVHAIGGG